MICWYCKAETFSGALRCAKCGHALAATIPTPLLAHPAAQGDAVSSVAAPSGERATVRLPSAILLRMTSGQQFILRGQTDYAIGRLGAGRERPDVDLAAWYGFEGGVSREHVAIHVGGEGVFVKDVDSVNETIHNGFRLMPQQWYPLGDGDELKLGAIILRVSFQYS
jgi:pSer/pThr/pTyr-binding forkhead associated (FHA) protein